jgi:hypothetical protein
MEVKYGPATSNVTEVPRNYTEKSKQIFPEMKLRGLGTNSYIPVSVSDLYIPTIGLPILLKENTLLDGTNVRLNWNIESDMNVCWI